MEMLRKYLEKVRELHAIAFLQWRLLNPRTLKWDVGLLEQLIKVRIYLLN